MVQEYTCSHGPVIHLLIVNYNFIHVVCVDMLINQLCVTFSYNVTRYYYCFCCIVTGSQPPVSFGRGLFQHAKAYTPLSPPLSQQSSQHLSPIDTPIPVSVLSPPLSQLSLEQKQGEHLSSTSPSQSITGHSQTAVAAPRQSTSPKSMPPSSSGPLVTEKMKKGTSGNTYVL